jgi:hypothetical protein
MGEFDSCNGDERIIERVGGDVARSAIGLRSIVNQPAQSTKFLTVSWASCRTARPHQPNVA